LFLHGLSSVIEAQHQFRIVARCSDGASCIEAIRFFQPDVAIVGNLAPDMSGLDALAVADCEDLPTRMAILAVSGEDRNLQASSAAGVHAVIPDDVDLEVLVQIVRQIADDQRPPTLSSPEQIVPREQAPAVEKSVMALTERERQIMRLVSEGLSNKEIGRRLNLTDGTIKVHLHHIFQKLEIANRTALAALAVSQNDDGDRAL
jgi:two-component system nitrate/nitrite response regulator NarL